MPITIVAYWPNEMVIYTKSDGTTWYVDLDGSAPVQVEEVDRISFLDTANIAEEDVWEMCVHQYDIVSVDIYSMWWRFFRIVKG